MIMRCTIVGILYPCALSCPVRQWLQNKGGKGIPHAEAMRRLRLELWRWNTPGRLWKTWPLPIRASRAVSSKLSSAPPKPARAT